MGYTYGEKPIWKTRPESICALQDALGRKLTAREAAKELSEKFGVEISRNSVIGKATRLGITIEGERKNAGWFKPSDKPKTPKPERLYSVRSKPVAHLLPSPPEPIAIPVSRRVSIVELTHNSCRWPIGDPRAADFAYCGADRVKPHDESNAYCAAHAVIAYTPRPTRQITPEHRRAMLAGKIKAKRQGEVSWSE